jgi:Fe-S-cluster containining protein
MNPEACAEPRPQHGQTRAADGGLQAFSFLCHRCGHCCSGGTGAVWVEPAEVAGLAAALGLEPAVFAERHLRRISDPRSGEPRLSLREEGGRCALLEGAQRCTVYEARPEHCRSFPFWPAVLSEPAAFEAARATCPGIAVDPPAPARAAAFEQLSELYREVDAQVAASGARCELSGLCCRFEDAGHELFATALEADYAAARHPDAPPPEAPGRCPYHVAGRCTAREGRPLGCRTYFCDPRTEEALAQAHEQLLGRIRLIERGSGYPAAYGRFPALLAARGVGVGVRAGDAAVGGLAGGGRADAGVPRREPLRGGEER